jgi:MFS transporter, ACS family, D-galactonate transporter
MRAHVDTSRAWLVVGLLFLFMLINFADKAVLGLSAAPIMRELGLTHTQFGLVGTSFFTLFSLSAVCVGFLVNRVPTGWVLMTMTFIWSMCQLPMLLTIDLPMLIANRVALGLGEGAAYPVVLHAAYKWFPNDRRPLPTSLIELGSSVGTGVAAPAIVYLIVAYSWHVAFGVLGLLSLLWCFVWLAGGREGPLVGANVEVGGTPRVSYRRLLTSRTFVGCVAVGFVAYWQITLAIVWLPAYLTQHVGYTATQVGWIMTLASLSQIVLLPILAAGSQKLKRQGLSSRLTRGCIPAAAGSVSV